ncbi:MAG: protease family protein [Thermoanaerobaculia bacterium]|jgi:membrane protease YdiL (CAAX protease family)|nr:protease family protein [Thermoanaerobaculia bacterium]
MHSGNEADIKPFTAIVLHFLPAIAIAGAYWLATPWTSKNGVPHVAVLLAAFAVIGIPMQLGIIRRVAKAAGHSVVRFVSPIPLWQHIVGAIVLIAIEFLLLRLPLGRVSDYLAGHVFISLPAAFSPAADDDLAMTSRSILLPVLLLQLLIDGIINPLVEERYFRGFLLPQLGRLRLGAPVVSTLLFAIAHFWQPYNYLSIFVYVLPLTLFTWWRKNYYQQAFVHCFANSFGAVLALAAYFRGSH